MSNGNGTVQHSPHWTGPRLNFPAVLTVMILLTGQIGAVFWWASKVQHEAVTQRLRIGEIENQTVRRADNTDAMVERLRNQYVALTARATRMEQAQEINSGLLRQIWRAVRHDDNSGLAGLPGHALARREPRR